jgi:hypothetical protein
VATEDDTKDQDDTGTKDQDDTGTEDQDDTGTEDKPADDKPKDDVDPEVAKAIKRRDAAITARKKAEAEAQALRDKYEKDKTDPLAQANSRLVKAEAKTVLTASGVAKEDQTAVMRYLALDDVQVDNDGNVDTDAIQDAVDELKKIFGKGAKDIKRTPRIDTRDKGGNGAKPADAASARRREMLGY